MQESIGKLAVPSIWIAIISFIAGIVAHFSASGVVGTLTADAYLEITQVFLLLAIAAAMVPKNS